MAVARLLTIYIEEAHASNEWRLPESVVEKDDKVAIAVHKTINDRLAAAALFAKNRGIPEEMQQWLVCDSMLAQVNDRYDAWPERLYVLIDGVVVYKGGPGPFEYKVSEVQDFLNSRFGSR